MVLPRAPVVLGLAGGWQRRLHGNPPEMEGERPQDASNGGGEEEVRLRGVDDYLWKNVQRNLRATWLLLVAGHLRCEGGTIISAPARI